MSTGGPGGGERRPQPDDGALVAHEEEARVDRRREGIGTTRVRREVSQEKVHGEYPRRRDELVSERVQVGDDDSGEIETLPDGSISVPLFEEELVITKRTVLRERVIVRKETITEWETVEAELRRETIEVDSDDAPARSVDLADER
jgi:uncharacterized protein (TIGR02271 family)